MGISLARNGISILEELPMPIIIESDIVIYRTMPAWKLVRKKSMVNN